MFEILDKIRNYHEAIGSVFGEVAPALSQFQIYRSMRHVHDELLKQIHNVLISFVKICAHVVKYRQGGKWDHFKETARVVFTKTPDLQEELSAFRSSLQGQRDVERTVTLEAAI